VRSGHEGACGVIEPAEVGIDIRVLAAGQRGARAKERCGRLREKDRIDRMGHDRLSLRPGGEPRILRTTGKQECRRGVEDFSLHPPSNSHATGGNRLTVENDKIKSALVEVTDDHRLGGTFDVVQERHIDRWATPQRRPNTGSDVGIVAVYKDS